MLPKCAKVKRKAVNKSTRAGVLFPVARFHRYLKKRLTKFRISSAAPVYIAAVLEYLNAEVLELAGNMAKDNKRVRITPRHIYLSVFHDMELNKLLKNVTMPSSGMLIRPYFTTMPAKIIKGGVATTPNKTNTSAAKEQKANDKKEPKVVGKRKRKSRFTPKKKLKANSKDVQKSGGLVILSEKILSKGQKLTVVQGNIIDIEADALVHPTNADLALAGEIGKMLERIGGKTFVDEVKMLRRQGKLDDNTATMCPGNNFSSKNVIHINSPTWKSPDPLRQLDTAIYNILDFAIKKKLKSIAVPSIGSGSAGFPKQAAAESILRTMGSYFRERPRSTLKQIHFVLYDKESVDVYILELARMQD